MGFFKSISNFFCGKAFIREIPEDADLKEIQEAAALSSRVYKDNQSDELYDDIGYRVETFINRKPYDTQLAVLQKEHIIAVVFRGTSSFEDAKQDALFRKERLTFIPETLGGVIKAHRGVLAAYMSVRAEVKTTVRELESRIRRKLRAVPRVIVTGHSLGGGLALLFALDMAITMTIKATVRTFGALRVFNKKGAKLFNRTLPDTILFRSDGDIVPTLPKIGYKHPELFVRFDNGEYLPRPGRIRNIFKMLRPSSYKAHGIIQYVAQLAILEETIQQKRANGHANKGEKK